MVLPDPVVERKIKTDLLSMDELPAEPSREQLLDDPLAFTVAPLEAAPQLVGKGRDIETQERTADFDRIGHAGHVLPQKPSLQINPLEYLEQAHPRSVHRAGRLRTEQ